MKRNRCYYCIIAVVLAMLPMLTSCRQELCYDHYPMFDVRFSWEREWERDYGQYHMNDWSDSYYGYSYDQLRPQTPEWINMIRYFSDGQSSEKFISPDGRKFIVEDSRESSVLLYNGDTECIVLSDVASSQDARASATSRSRSRSSLEAMYQKHTNSRTTNPPDILYSAYIDNLPALKNHDLRALHVKMQPLVYSYVINYEFESGLEYVVLARGAIGGMAESVYLRTGVTSEESSIILFDCEVKSYGCQALVRSFGIPGFPDIYYGRTASQPNDREYTLNLELLLKNGKTIEYNFDITDQIAQQPRGGVVKVSGIKVKAEQAQANSGFKVDVSDWDESDEVIDIKLGGQQ